MCHAVLAEVVYIAKLTNKYLLVKYNCTGKFFFGSSCCLCNKTVILLTLVGYRSYTTRVSRIIVEYIHSIQKKGRPTMTYDDISNKQRNNDVERNVILPLFHSNNKTCRCVQGMTLILLYRLGR